MKALHISTSDLDGGAARAAYRLHQGLIDAGVSSKMLVRAKFGGNRSVITNKNLISQLGSKIDVLPLKKYPNHDGSMFSTQWFPDSIAGRVREINPDIINLHWICNGFLKIESLAKLNKPLVWTLHDMWPFTGGCHYAQDCEQYINQCGRCPILHSNRQKDLSSRILQRKISAWQDLNLTIVTPSQWLAKCAQRSILFKDLRIEVIANGINSELFSPGYKREARELLKLPQDKRLVLFVAGSTTGDPRKGFKYLVDALHLLQCRNECNFELAILGEESPETSFPKSFRVHYLGKFSDEMSLALVYNAADVFVAPSIQDNLPNTVVEALACGIPCIAFNIGGMPDMIDHLQNGFLVTPFKVESLADGISKILNNLDLHDCLSKNARSKAVNVFGIEHQTKNYLNLYKDILDAT